MIRRGRRGRGGQVRPSAPRNSPSGGKRDVEVAFIKALLTSSQGNTNTACRDTLSLLVRDSLLPPPGMIRRGMQREVDWGLRQIGAVATFIRSGSASQETRWASTVGYVERTFILAASLVVPQALDDVTTGVAGEYNTACRDALTSRAI